MPEVNGKRYRTFGQGYAQETGAKKDALKPKPEPEAGSEGGEPKREMQIKELGGGRFQTKTKHEDGKVTREEHESPEELQGHVQSHFDLENEDQDQDNESGEALGHDEGSEHGGADAIHSILG